MILLCAACGCRQRQAAGFSVTTGPEHSCVNSFAGHSGIQPASLCTVATPSRAFCGGSCCLAGWVLHWLTSQKRFCACLQSPPTASVSCPESEASFCQAGRLILAWASISLCACQLPLLCACCALCSLPPSRLKLITTVPAVLQQWGGEGTDQRQHWAGSTCTATTSAAASQQHQWRGCSAASCSPQWQR